MRWLWMVDCPSIRHGLRIMMDFNSKPQTRNTAAETDRPHWIQAYSERHRPVRVTEFPSGIAPPKKVRIYQRSDHYLLQWWDRAHKKSLSQRINGDFVEAIVKAREIDALLSHFHSSGQPAGRVSHEQLVKAYVEDLTKRADAGEIDPRTVERYRASLQFHYLPFVTQPDVARRYRHASDIDRNFQLEFARYLQISRVPANGNSRGALRPMRGSIMSLTSCRRCCIGPPTLNAATCCQPDSKTPFDAQTLLDVATVITVCPSRT